MADEERSDEKIQYRSYDEFCRRFYGSSEKPAAKENGEADEAASFGRRLARELAGNK